MLLGMCRDKKLSNPFEILLLSFERTIKSMYQKEKTEKTKLVLNENKHCYRDKIRMFLKTTFIQYRKKSCK